MFTSSILNIAITLVFIYLVLAIMITGINEMIFTFSRTRARYLERAIDNLFFDDEWKIIAEKIKSSPFLNSLKKAKGVFPAYIPASNFVKALLTSIGNGNLNIEGIRSDLASKTTQGEFSRILAALVQQKDMNMENLQKEIEQLYDNAMDRITGWFKRNAKIMSFAFALAISVLLNIDTIDITTNLWKNKGKAEQIADFIATAQQNFQKDDSGHVVLNYAGDTLATVEKKVSSPGNPADSSDIRAGMQKPVQTVTGTYHILTDLGIPMGWTKDNIPQVPGNCWMAVILWIVKIMGILLTAFATSLGAPFWFDVLSKVTPLKQSMKEAKK